MLIQFPHNIQDPTNDWVNNIRFALASHNLATFYYMSWALKEGPQSLQ